MVKQATVADIPVIESILLDAVRWMDATGQHQWEEANVRWEKLSQYYNIHDFYLACDGDTPAACMALIDYDPHFWPNIPKGESLFLHKVAVLRTHAGKGYVWELVDFAKGKASDMGIQSLRLDCHLRRYKVRAVYEKLGFACVEETVLFGQYETALYICNLS